MANRKVNPDDKRVFTPFTLPQRLKPEIKAMAKAMDISMSEFVESAIIEKMEKINEKA